MNVLYSWDGLQGCPVLEPHYFILISGQIFDTLHECLLDKVLDLLP